MTRIPDRWHRGDTMYLLQGFGHGLVEFVWRHAHLFSLAHDVSDGGLALALREAAAWSGTDVVRVELTVGEGVVVAATERPPWDDLVELGRVA